MVTTQYARRNGPCIKICNQYIQLVCLDEGQIKYTFCQKNMHLKKKRVGRIDFELGIDMISLPNEFGETLYEHRHDIINLLQTPGIASTGFVADFVPLIQPTLSETIDPNVERVIAAGISPILAPELLIEPGTIENGDSLLLELTDDSDSNVQFQIQGVSSETDELRHNDWVLSVSDADYSTAAVAYTGNESNRIVDSESYTEFLQLARRLTVDIGGVNQAFFDVQIGWDHNTIPILESTEIEPIHL